MAQFYVRPRGDSPTAGHSARQPVLTRDGLIPRARRRAPISAARPQFTARSAALHQCLALATALHFAAGHARPRRLRPMAKVMVVDDAVSELKLMESILKS